MCCSVVNVTAFVAWKYNVVYKDIPIWNFVNSKLREPATSSRFQINVTQVECHLTIPGVVDGLSTERG